MTKVATNVCNEQVLVLVSPTCNVIMQFVRLPNVYQTNGIQGSNVACLCRLSHPNLQHHHTTWGVPPNHQ